MEDSKPSNDKRGLAPYLSPLGAWALALGTAIGWGSLVVTSNSYLLQAGPWGSILGLLLGAVVMVLVARNYHYMINCFPDSGGAYTYAKEAYGYDHGFMTAWFLGLTYIAMLWANASSLPLFAKYFIGDMFQRGYLYTVFGYDVYLGEALLTIAAIALTALLLARSRLGAMRTMIAAAIILTTAITACFLASALGFGEGAAGAYSFEPGFLPDSDALGQVLAIACISPWAFIGFENISHSAGEFAFPRHKAFGIMLAAIAVATALYLFVLLLSVMAYPPGFDSWLDYVSNRGSLGGIAALPPFYVAYRYMGDVGAALLMVALLCLVLTSLVGNTLALSRLFFALGKDRVLPPGFSRVSNRHIPVRAVVLVAALSVFVPFLGRTAIGWIVDVTTLGATIIYGLVSAATLRVARARSDRLECATGLLGVAAMIAFGAHIVLPSLFASRSLEPESFFLFAVWGIIGFIVFRVLLSRDSEHRFGRSTVVWIALLSLVLFVTFVWMDQTLVQLEADAANRISADFAAATAQSGGWVGDQDVIGAYLDELRESSVSTMLVAAALFVLAAVMLLMNFSCLSKWARENEEELDVTRNVIYTDPLTGLPSMARFLDLAREGAGEAPDGEGRPAAVAFNLAGMGDFNAKHGRDKGDRLLCSFADVLRRHFGDDACSRFADDRFFAYAPEGDVVKRVEAVFGEFESFGEGKSLPIRAGIYVCHDRGEIATVGLDRARIACDRDRGTWRSHITWFEETMSDEARMRLHVLDNVERAISEGWVRPYYQAIIDSETGKLGAEEALARWIDPEYGFLSPGQFIPILEDAGLLHKVDLHMVDCVLADLAGKAAGGFEVVPVSVNISLRDMGHLDVADEIIAKTAASGVSPALLCIEFTESAASEDPVQLEGAIERLHAAGFQVWMDDFGSGFSSLNSLKNFDFDLVKLDMDFLRGERGERTWDVIEGVIRITRKLGMRTLAEGIETPEHARRLCDIGCDLLQGFHYAKPMPLDEALAHRGDWA